MRYLTINNETAYHPASSRITNRYLDIDIRHLLPLLWLFIILNIVFRDIHEFVKADFIDQVMSGVVNGYAVTEGLLLIGGLVSLLTISMVVLSACLRRGPNRIVNMVTSALLGLSVISNGYQDLDDILHMVAEAAAAFTIFVIAYRWKR